MQLLQYLGHTSPECLENLNRKLNEPAVPPMSVDLENEAIASVISQRNIELDESTLSQQIESMSGQRITRPTSRNSAKSTTCDNLPSNQGKNLFSAVSQKCHTNKRKKLARREDFFQFVSKQFHIFC